MPRINEWMDNTHTHQSICWMKFRVHKKHVACVRLHSTTFINSSKPRKDISQSTELKDQMCDFRLVSFQFFCSFVVAVAVIFSYNTFHFGCDCCCFSGWRNICDSISTYSQNELRKGPSSVWISANGIFRSFSHTQNPKNAGCESGLHKVYLGYGLEYVCTVQWHRSHAARRSEPWLSLI